MSRRRSLGRRLFVLVGSAATIGMCGYFLPMQALATTRVTLTGRLGTPLESPVTLAVKPPAGLGLTRLERQRGMPPLNDEREQEVLLTGESFEITFPVTYCTTYYPNLSELPPPPVAFYLRFSDVPEESYRVWSRPLEADYDVSHPSVGSMRKEVAQWELRPGHLTKSGEGFNASWAFDLEVVRQGSRVP